MTSATQKKRRKKTANGVVIKITCGGDHEVLRRYLYG